MKEQSIKKIIASMLAIVLLLGCLSGCTSWDNFRSAFIDKKPEPRPVLQIAVLEPQTGEYSKDAADEIEGMILANELFNTALEYDVELVFYDNESNVDKTQEKALEILESDAVLVLGSYGSSLSLVAGDVFIENEMPAVAATCSNPLLMQLNPFYTSANSIDTYEALAVAEFVANGLKSEKVGTMYIAGSDYAKAKADEFTDKYNALIGDIEVPSVAIPEGVEEFDEFLETLEREGVDTIYMPESADRAYPIVSTSRELGYTFTWIGTDSWEEMGLEDLYFSLEYDPDRWVSPVTNSFLEAYVNKYGSENKPSKSFALGFDAYLLAINGIEIAGETSDKTLLAESIRSIDKMPGATGSITINEGGSALRNMYIYTITSEGASEVYSTIPELAN